MDDKQALKIIKENWPKDFDPEFGISLVWHGIKLNFVEGQTIFEYDVQHKDHNGVSFEAQYINDLVVRITTFMPLKEAK